MLPLNLKHNPAPGPVKCNSCKPGGHGCCLTKAMLKNLIFLSILALLFPGTVQSIEFPRTTRDYVGRAAFIAVVEVENIVAAPGGANLLQYRVQVLEEWKGKLPSVVDIRIFSASRVIQPAPVEDQPGSRWVVFLGNRNSEGFYPLKSLHWGKIELMEDSSGNFWLARPVTGFGREYDGRRVSLEAFRKLVKGAP